MTLPAPYDQIRRLVGRRTHPNDWPNIHDEWDAYDENGELLMTLGLRAVNQLLGAPHHPGVIMESADGRFAPITVSVSTTLDFCQTISIPIGDRTLEIVNPEHLPTRDEIVSAIEGLFKDKP